MHTDLRYHEQLNEADTYTRTKYKHNGQSSYIINSSYYRVDGVRLHGHLSLPSGQRAGHKRRTPPDRRSPGNISSSVTLPLSIPPPFTPSLALPLSLPPYPPSRHTGTYVASLRCGVQTFHWSVCCPVGCSQQSWSVSAVGTVVTTSGV